jgi:hypothetical protein
MLTFASVQNSTYRSDLTLAISYFKTNVHNLNRLATTFEPEMLTPELKDANAMSLKPSLCITFLNNSTGIWRTPVENALRDNPAGYLNCFSAALDQTFGGLKKRKYITEQEITSALKLGTYALSMCTSHTSFTYVIPKAHDLVKVMVNYMEYLDYATLHRLSTTSFFYGDKTLLALLAKVKSLATAAPNRKN